MPQDAANLVEWQRRIKEIYATGNPPPQESITVRSPTPARPNSQPCRKVPRPTMLSRNSSGELLPLPVVYQNDAFVYTRCGEKRSQDFATDYSVPSTKFDAVTFDMDGLMFNSEDVYTLAGSEFFRARLPVHARIERRDDGPSAAEGLRGHDRLALA